MTETSMQAQVVIPMAVSLAFGVLFATIVTLVLIPCLYVMIEDMKQIVSRIGHNLFGNNTNQDAAQQH